MIAMVGMLVAAAVAALLGFGILVAKRVDQESALREVDLARRQLSDLQTKVKVDLATFTRWDEYLRSDVGSIRPGLGASLFRTSPPTGARP